MTNLLAPVAKAKFFDNNGKPAVGYKLFTYEAGTSTKADTFPSATSVIPNPNPIILDFRGEANVWIPPNVAYKFVFAPPNDTDPPAAPIWTVDDIVDSQLVTLWAGVDTGIANAYVVDFEANFTAYQDGILIYFLASTTNTGASTLNVNGLGPVSILTANGVALSPGMIAANQMTGVIYRGGNWYLINTAIATGSFTATLTGMTALTQGTVNYSISGGLCTLTTPVAIGGTSNSTALTLTGLPAVARPSSRRATYTECLDNGAVKFTSCAFNTPGVIDFFMMVVSGSNVIGSPIGFTAAGVKGLGNGWSITYPL